jgi:hypothetical protein
MSQLSGSANVEFHQHTNRTFDPYMPIVVIGALAGGTLDARSWPEPALASAAAG